MVVSFPTLPNPASMSLKARLSLFLQTLDLLGAGLASIYSNGARRFT
jgi:hypothetical protein